MRWVEDQAEFKKIFLEARTCVYIDSGRCVSSLRRLIFDDAMLCTDRFADMVQTLMAFSRESTSYYIVLDPDPVHYFHRHFRKYPVLEIAYGDSSDTYLKSLNEDPGGSPPDAIGTNCWAWVVVPHSIKWFVHALRDSEDRGGHLWIPQEWMGTILKTYPFVRSGTINSGDIAPEFGQPSR